VAVAAFTLAILLEATDWYKFITPVLGLSIFVGIATHTWRLQSRRVAGVVTSPTEAG
jgi:hypothetical protein